MKLELNSKEVEAVLLEYAQAKWPGQFNTVESDHSYEGIRGVVLTHKDKQSAQKEAI